MKSVVPVLAASAVLSLGAFSINSLSAETAYSRPGGYRDRSQNDQSSPPSPVLTDSFDPSVPFEIAKAPPSDDHDAGHYSSSGSEGSILDLRRKADRDFPSLSKKSSFHPEEYFSSQSGGTSIYVKRNNNRGGSEQGDSKSSAFGSSVAVKDIYTQGNDGSEVWRGLYGEGAGMSHGLMCL